MFMTTPEKKCTHIKSVTKTLINFFLFERKIISVNKRALNLLYGELAVKRKIMQLVSMEDLKLCFQFHTCVNSVNSVYQHSLWTNTKSI